MNHLSNFSSRKQMKILTNEIEIARKKVFFNYIAIKHKWNLSAFLPQKRKWRQSRIPQAWAPSNVFRKGVLYNFLIQIVYEKSPKILNGNIDNTFLDNLKTVFHSPQFFLQIFPFSTRFLFGHVQFLRAVKLFTALRGAIFIGLQPCWLIMSPLYHWGISE